MPAPRLEFNQGDRHGYLPAPCRYTFERRVDVWSSEIELAGLPARRRRSLSRAQRSLDPQVLQPRRGGRQGPPATPRTTFSPHGGHIFFAVADGKPVGCCALLPNRQSVYELRKMAVAEALAGPRHRSRLLASLSNQARARGAASIYLETNTRLANAIHLYESLGFKRLPARPRPTRAATSSWNALSNRWPHMQHWSPSCR